MLEYEQVGALRKSCAARRSHLTWRKPSPSETHILGSHVPKTRMRRTAMRKAAAWTVLQKPLARRRILRAAAVGPGRITGARALDAPEPRSRTSSWWRWRTSSGRRATCPCARDWTWRWRSVLQRPRWRSGFRTAEQNGRNKTRGLQIASYNPRRVRAWVRVRDFAGQPWRDFTLSRLSAVEVLSFTLPALYSYHHMVRSCVRF